MFNKDEFLPSEADLKSFLNKVKEMGTTKYSQNFPELISESGDVSGTPFAHWHWKKKYLAKCILWPKNEEQISSLLKLANNYNVPVTPRGAGSSYFGSSIPTYGGVILNLKSLRGYQIEQEKRIVHIKAGTSYVNLRKSLKKKGLELPVYPTSELTSTVGGWFSEGGNIGIGTIQNEGLEDNIVQIKYVTPQGEIKATTEKSIIESFLGTCGILGIITEISLRIKPLTEKVPFYFGFNNFKNFNLSLNSITQREFNSLFFLQFSDKRFHLRERGKSLYSNYLLTVLSKGEQNISEEKKKLFSLIKSHNGVYLGERSSKSIWNDIPISEMKIKRNVPVLMLQSFKIDIKNLEKIIDKFKQLSDDRNLNRCFNGIIDKNGKIRLNLFTPTDNAHMVPFFASKGVLHKIVKKVYRNDWGRIYSYGLLNSIYLHKYEDEKLKKLQKQKQKWDPNFILNPYKLVKTHTSYRRMNLLFELDLLWRKIAVKLGIDNQMLNMNRKVKEVKRR